MNFFILGKSVAFVLLLFFSSMVNAEIVKGPSPNQPGEIAVEIVASNSPEYIQKWISTPPSEAVTIKRIKETAPNKLVVISFLVSGMDKDKEGNFSFSVSMNILGPDGKLVFGQRNYARGQGKLPEKATFIMADPALDLILEPNDPPGLYKVVAQVVDLVTMRKSGDSYEIELLE